ncbi:MAG: iron-sulfur cluster assembly scaffold protein [Candidatus Aenigmatarchaeota archaeon]
MYTEKVIEHFLHPHNMGEIKDADGVGEVGNILCGDIMRLYIKVKDNKIKDIKFKTLGCAAAISTSSIITDMVKGKSIDDALRISKDDIANSLGGLPPAKIHCSLLATEALSEAIYDYLSKNKLSIPEKLKKLHLKTKKELEMIERKYKKFVEIQREDNIYHNKK